MQNVYTSYTKKIESRKYFFIKKFLVFPEFKNVPPVLEGYGMHTDFDKACGIAAVIDTEIKKRLLQEIENGMGQAKVIDLTETSFGIHKVAGL